MTAVIDVTDLSFGYGVRPVIRGLSLSLHKGELVGLIGPNGAGKTTLLHLLLGILRPSSGMVRLGGVPMNALLRREVALRVTLVPQEPASDFAFTVREIVAMGRTPHLGRFRPERETDLRAVKSALAATEVEPLADRLVSELSGGERKRAHIARALAQETDVLLLDEPTASLDMEHQLHILELLRSLVDTGKSVLVALHDLSLAARFCDRLLLVADGTLAAGGAPSDVLTEENLARYFRIVARVDRADDGRLLAVIPLSATRS